MKKIIFISLRIFFFIGIIGAIKVSAKGDYVLGFSSGLLSLICYLLIYLLKKSTKGKKEEKDFIEFEKTITRDFSDLDDKNKKVFRKIIFTVLFIVICFFVYFAYINGLFYKI